MQNRYAGHLGDFSKLVLLRGISKTGLSLGLNWYLNPYEEENGDGKHTLDNFPDCERYDPELFSRLLALTGSGKRTVAELESLRLVPNCSYFSDNLPLPADIQARPAARTQWFENSLKSLNGAEVVFFDPDNGIVPTSVKSARSRKALKYAMPEEIETTFKNGSSVVIYNHHDRKPIDLYKLRLQSVMPALPHRRILHWTRGSPRSYLWLLQPEHTPALTEVIYNLKERGFGEI
ncbi:MAG: hypothetical protein HS115_19255 [Spirochaetales bacterium]|nr:hypothetical protein [Spirochaetales bacterium]